MAVQLDAPARALLDPVPDRAHERLVELDGAGHVDREELVLLPPELVERPADPERHRQPVALCQELEEVEEALVAAVDDPADRLLLLTGAEARREEERLQVLRLAEGIRPCAQLVVDLVQHAAFLGGLEQRARVDLGEILHQLLRPSPSEANAEKSTSASASSISRFWSSPSRLLRATFS